MKSKPSKRRPAPAARERKPRRRKQTEFDRLCRVVAKAEGLKSQTSIGNVRETAALVLAYTQWTWQVDNRPMAIATLERVAYRTHGRRIRDVLKRLAEAKE